jgi:glycosyltransferase involved in cell wall biosynthesis
MYQVSVVIPSIRKKLIPDLELALQNQTYPIHEILVIPDEEKRGPAWARNQGIEKSTGDWIAFIDDDCIPKSNWIEKLVSACESFNADVAGGTYIETDPLLREIRNKKEYPQQNEIDHVGNVGTGGNIMYSRFVLDKCKSIDGYIYNERYKLASAEDHELCWRLRQQEAVCVFVVSHHIHLKRVNFSSYMKMCYVRGVGISYLHEGTKTGKLVPFQKSIIWSRKGNQNIFYLLKAIAFKAIGPFDFKNFSSIKFFFYYWAGEKMQILGFLFHKIKYRN